MKMIRGMETSPVRKAKQAEVVEPEEEKAPGRLSCGFWVLKVLQERLGRHFSKAITVGQG